MQEWVSQALDNIMKKVDVIELTYASRFKRFEETMKNQGQQHEKLEELLKKE